MAADLTLNTPFGRRSIVLLNDQLVEVVHRSTKDRLLRLNYDRIQSVIVWRSLPYWQMVAFLIVLGGIGTVLLLMGVNLPDGEPATIIAMIVLGILAFVELYYVYAGKTHIQITRGAGKYVFSGVVRPGKRKQFLTRLRAAISFGQREAQARALERQRQREEAARSDFEAQVSEAEPGTSPAPSPL